MLGVNQVDLSHLLRNGRLDFNDASTLRYDLQALRIALAQAAESWVPRLFPAGRRLNNEWRLADISGRPPRKTGSCVIQLRGEHAGFWNDFDSRVEHGGDPLDTFARGHRLTVREVISLAAQEVGLSPTTDLPAPRPAWATSAMAHRAAPPPDPKAEMAAAQKDREIEDILRRAVPIAGTLVSTYLESRKLPIPAEADLKFIPDLIHIGSMAGWPAMIGIVTDAAGNRVGGIHRTWLARDGAGKAPVDSNKKMLGDVGGGVVKLAPWQPGAVLGYSEGIETGIAAMKLFGVPVWACLGTSGMKNAPAPAGLAQAIIFADKGEAGAAAAAALRDRLQGLGVQAEIKTPLSEDDFAEDLCRGLSAQNSPIHTEKPATAVQVTDAESGAAALTKDSDANQIKNVLQAIVDENLDQIQANKILEVIKNKTKISIGKLFEVLKKMQQTSGGKNAAGLLLPSAPWQKRIIIGFGGEPKPLLANAALILRNAAEWRHSLIYNALTGVPEINGPLPWVYGDVVIKEEWTEKHDLKATEWMQHIGLHITPEIIRQAIESVAEENQYHPVRDYLNALKWDGKARLDTFLRDYMGTVDNDYTRAVGARWMIGAVARIFQPGCKMDTALILEGDQGLRKSMALKILAEPWFTDEISDLGSKDAAMQTRGTWIIEIAELDSMSRGEVGKIKAFMTRTVDRFRPPYGRRIIQNARQCVFAGTVNPDGTGYLKDTTGGRRFWPVKCTVILADKLREDRDQLWAEAHTRYKAGEAWWLDNEKLVKLAQDQQAERQQGDPWDEAITRYLTQHLSPSTDQYVDRLYPIDDVSVAEILSDALKIEVGRWSRIDQMRVAQYFKVYGWIKYRRTSDMSWRYKKIY